MRCRELDIFKILGIFLEFFGNSKSKLITKSYLNMEGIDFFVKILVFVKILG